MIYFRFCNRRILSSCKKHIVIFSLVLFFCYVYYVEVLLYVYNRNNWFQMKCSNTSKCLKVLLVADPQIIEHEQGNKWNHLRFFTKYDSDSYLKKTYRQALNFVQPDVTIFLGDLMDEGSIATDEEYNENLIRFLNIFPKQDDNKNTYDEKDLSSNSIGIFLCHSLGQISSFHKRRMKLSYSFSTDVITSIARSGEMRDPSIVFWHPHYKLPLNYTPRVLTFCIETPMILIRFSISQIWIPGDNDIGGEGLERITPKKLNRFQDHFNQDDVIDVQNVTFFKVNYLTHSFPKHKKGNFYDTNRINIVLSHVPLMFTPSAFVEKVISHLQPQVIFAGHLHRAMVINTYAFLRQDRHIIPITTENNKVFKFTLGSSDMYEIIVPTCSYRMGTDKIGFGHAIIENEELQYTVLWSPSRFLQLWNYIFMLLLLLIFFIIVKFFK